MENIVITLSKYFIAIAMVIYTILSFRYIITEDEENRKGYGLIQKGLVLFIHFSAFLVLLVRNPDTDILRLYFVQLIFLIIYPIVFRKIYHGASIQLLSNICLFIVLGMIMLTRLNYSHALRQFLIIVAGSIITLPVPWVLDRFYKLSDYKFIYAGIGIVMLLLVFLAGSISYGAKMTLSVLGFRFQPSEFVKIIYVFFLSSILNEGTDKRNILICSFFASLHMAILILCKDLGTALIFFSAFIIILYIASGQRIYLIGGAGAAAAAGIIAYNLFNHVRIRVSAWIDPFADIDNKGYQMAHSLFAIGTGGLFGMGIGGGMPSKIPIVEKDFIFSAISEEMGAIVAVCLCLICLCCILEMMLISSYMDVMFYRLIGVGLAVIYAIQVFLTIGGAIKLIPSTGVTLPFIAYGGSSIFSSFILFMIIQGLHVIMIGDAEAYEEDNIENAEIIEGSDNVKDYFATGRKNHGISRISLVISFVFSGMSIFLLYFVISKAPEIIGNPYNPRDKVLAESVERGKIISSDGAVLAETLIDKEGNEYRSYPYGSKYAYITGYSNKGKTGLESYANYYLLRSHVNQLEIIANGVSGKKSPGDSLILSIDTKLQQTAVDALNEKRGAVLVAEVSTGRVLTMVSLPAFDPNTITQDWEQINKNEQGESMLLNRAAQGLYPPGSTFKVETLLAFKETHPDEFFDYSYECDGVYEDEDGNKINCYANKAHGKQDIREAFVNSCNGAFADIASRMKADDWSKLTERLMFNKKLPFSLVSEQSSFSLDDSASQFIKAQTGIGQGNTLMTPLHNLMLAQAIANDGIMMKPYTIDAIETAGGDIFKKFKPKEYKKIFSSEEAEMLKEWMRAVVTDGTASALKNDSYTVCAKTGSAEYDNGHKTDAWCIAFAPMENPEIAVCVLVEDGETGGRTAAPIVRKIMDEYFLK